MCYAYGNNIINSFARHKIKQIIRRNKLFFSIFPIYVILYGSNKI